MAGAWRRADQRPVRHGVAAAELDARGAAGVPRRNSGTLGLSRRLARPAADAGDPSLGRTAPGRVLPSSGPCARVSEWGERAARGGARRGAGGGDATVD